MIIPSFLSLLQGIIVIRPHRDGKAWGVAAVMAGEANSKPDKALLTVQVTEADTGMGMGYVDSSSMCRHAGIRAKHRGSQWLGNTCSNALACVKHFQRHSNGR